MKIINDIFWCEDSEDSEEKPIKKNVNKNKNTNNSKKIVKNNKTKRETIKKEPKESYNDLESIDWYQNAINSVIDETTPEYKRNAKAIEELSKILGVVGYKE